jgi:hypothetical protein
LLSLNSFLQSMAFLRNLIVPVDGSKTASNAQSEK